MPWCPQCKSEYVSGIEYCADCGSLLVQEDPNPPKPAPRPISGLVAGLLGGISDWIVWVLFTILLYAIDPSYLGRTIFICSLPFICSTAGFLIGMKSNAAFMPCLIGWLITASPLSVIILLSYADGRPAVSIGLFCFALFSTLLLGSISTVAGARFVRNRWSSLALWLVPTGIVTAAIITASNMVDFI